MCAGMNVSLPGTTLRRLRQCVQAECKSACDYTSPFKAMCTGMNVSLPVTTLRRLRQCVQA